MLSRANLEQRPVYPLHHLQMPRRHLRLLALLAWLGVVWTFWQVQIARPRQTTQLGFPIDRFPPVPAGHPIAIINASQDEVAFIDVATGRKQNVLKGDMSRVVAVIAARNL